MSSLEILLRALCAGLIYPGLFFLIVVGLLAESLRRRFAARVEGREAPPWLQPLKDLSKLWGRADFVPAGLIPAESDPPAQRLAAIRQESSRLGLYALPLLGLIALALGAVLLPVPGNLWPFLETENSLTARPLGADLLGSTLLFLVPALMAIVAGSAGGSVYGQVAGSRSFQLLAVCAIPFAVAIFGPAIAAQTLSLRTLAAGTSLQLLGVKALCGILFLLCLPAILRLRPMASAPGEALAGTMTDFGGTTLGLFSLLRWCEYLALALLFTVVYIPLAQANLLLLIFGLAFGLGVIGLVDVLFGQVRLRDALNFYLKYAIPTALVLLLALSFAVKM